MISPNPLFHLARPGRRGSFFFFFFFAFELKHNLQGSIEGYEPGYSNLSVGTLKYKTWPAKKSIRRMVELQQGTRGKLPRLPSKLQYGPNSAFNIENLALKELNINICGDL